MPCLAIHLAVAKEYLKKHSNENEEDFVLGSIAPDINIDEIDKYINGAGKDKNSHHFGKNNNDVDDPIEYMKNKVGLSEFLSCNDVKTSFLKAYFLHLICDFRFYSECITPEIVQRMSHDDLRIKIFNDYNRMTPILIQKYNLTIPNSIKQIISGHCNGPLEIFDENYIYQFIENMAKINLEEVKEKVLQVKDSKYYL